MAKRIKTFKKLSICLECKERFIHSVDPRAHSGMFCSTKCSNEYKKKQTLEKAKKDFKKGLLRDRRKIRVIILEIQGHVCAICKRKKWNGEPITLWLDHKDGNADNCKPNNFWLVCPNCDSQQPTFGGKNYGNGRTSRGLSAYGYC